MHRAAFTEVISLIAECLAGTLAVARRPALSAKSTNAQTTVQRVHLGCTPGTALLIAQLHIHRRAGHTDVVRHVADRLIICGAVSGFIAAAKQILSTAALRSIAVKIQAQRGTNRRISDAVEFIILRI